MYECILCACCSTSCPSLIGGTPIVLGPCRARCSCAGGFRRADDPPRKIGGAGRRLQSLGLPHDHELQRSGCTNTDEPGKAIGEIKILRCSERGFKDARLDASMAVRVWL